MKAEQLDEIFDKGEEDILPYLDLAKAVRPGPQGKRVNVDFPSWMIARLDFEAERLGVPPTVFDQGLDRGAIVRSKKIESNGTKVAPMRTEPVTTPNRKATKILADLEADQAPVLITQHGKPASYLMAVGTFDTPNRRLGILEGIARGERAIEEEGIVPHAEARKRMARWLRQGALR